MKRFRKLGALTACVLLVFLLVTTAYAAAAPACSGPCSHEAAVGTTHYDTLAEAAEAAPAGSTLVMLKDVTLTATLVPARSVTLDLNTFTLSGEAAVRPVVRFTQGGVIRNGTVEGSVQVQDCTVLIEKDAILNNTTADATLQLISGGEKTAIARISGIVTNEGTGCAVTSFAADKGTCELYILEEANVRAETTAVKLQCGGVLDISGGVLESKKDTVVAHIPQDQTLKASVTGGTILSKEGKPLTITADKAESIPTDFVTGGSFSALPEGYIPSYGQSVPNEDGTVTLLTQFTVSFQAGGCSGEMADITLRCGDAITLPDCGFTAPKGKDFDSWSIGSATYRPSSRYTPTEDTTVTALWKEHAHSGGKATCQKKAVCALCGESYGKLAAHSLTDVAAHDATCEEAGINGHSKCTRCGSCFVDGIEVSKNSLTIPAMGHEWEMVDGIPSTCEEGGTREHKKCTTCEVLRVDGKDVTLEELALPPLGHSFLSVPASAATCSEPGIRAHEVCERCTLYFLAGAPVDHTELTTATATHVLGDWQTDESYHWKSCIDCGVVFRLNGHADADSSGACDECNYEMPLETGESTRDISLWWLWLLPLVIAAVLAVLLVVKKRKAQ